MSKTFTLVVFYTLVAILFMAVMIGIQFLVHMAVATVGILGAIVVAVVIILFSSHAADYLIMRPAMFITNVISKTVGWIRGLFGSEVEAVVFA